MSSDMGKSPKKPGVNAAGQEEGAEKCANEALSVEETELTRNDDGAENSALMELKRPKLDLKVSDKSENPASDDSQGDDASGKQTSLTEPMASEADQEPEQKLDTLEEQAAKGTSSVDEPGNDKPGEESGPDVLDSGSGKSSCSTKSDRGDEITSGRLFSPRDEVEAAGGMLKLRYAVACDEELIRKLLAENSAVKEVLERKKPKLDNSVMQEEKQKVYLDAPAPSNSSEEESSDITDGEGNQTD